MSSSDSSRSPPPATKPKKKDKPKPRPRYQKAKASSSKKVHPAVSTATTNDEDDKKQQTGHLRQAYKQLAFLKTKLMKKTEGGIKNKRKSLHLPPTMSQMSLQLLRSASSSVADIVGPGRKTRLKSVIYVIKETTGISQFMKELRERREEYVRKMEEIMAKRRTSILTPDHPYVALRKKIEAMTQGHTYHIDYRPFMETNVRLRYIGIPLYATGYNNERKTQARRRQFMFGMRSTDRYDFDAENVDEFFDDPKQTSEKTWASPVETDVALLAMVFSAANLFRFPQACYVNGGLIFFLIYCLMMVMLIQPLILFELLVGQFSFKGEWGFSQLHKYTKGFSYVLLFVNLIYITMQNAIAGYTGLYAVSSFLVDPGECHPNYDVPCIPYNDIENLHKLLVDRTSWLEQHFVHERNPWHNVSQYLSTELFFRYYILHWKTKGSKAGFHWRLLVLFMLPLCCAIPTSVHTYLVSTMSRIWIYLACILPILLVLVLFHQYTFRGAYHTPQYFSLFRWERLGRLLFWCDAFEMAISTVGVGFGGLIRISENNHFSSKGLRSMAWITALVTMIFTFLCTMVVFTELAILGNMSKAKQFVFILAEGIGLTFVCLSGALLKMGPFWVISIIFGWITIFNIWPLIVATQMGVTYARKWLQPISHKWLKDLSSLAVVLLLQIALISIYIYNVGFAETDSFDLFGGCGAAYAVVLVEMGIAFVLLGFREFMTDIEIMLDAPMTFAFQIQMRYFVPTIVAVAYFVIAVSWFYNPPHETADHNNISGQTFWFGFFLGITPFLIMVTSWYYGLPSIIGKVKKTATIAYDNILHSKKNVRKEWQSHPRWLERRGAIFEKQTQLHESVFPFEGNEDAHRLARLRAEHVYAAHVSLRDKLRNLHESLHTKWCWMRMVYKLISLTKPKTVPQLVNRVLRKQNIDATDLELHFIRKLIHISSVCDLTTCTLDKMLGLHLEEQEIALLDQLIELITTYSDDSEEDEDSAEEEESESAEHVRLPKFSVWDMGDNGSISSATSSDVGSVHRKIAGKPKRDEEEVRLDLEMRIKRGLVYPYEHERRELERLRRQRYLKDWEAVRRFDAPPQEHFITVKVTRRHEEPLLMGLRVIVIPHHNHFVLKRIPLPKPLVVHTTPQQLRAAYPEQDMEHRIFSLVMQSIKRSLYHANLSDLLKPNNKISLLENIDAEVYSFIDPLKSCIVVLEGEGQADLRGNKWRWLHPTQVRRKPWVPPDQPHLYTWDYEATTVGRLIWEERERQRIDHVRKMPSDVVYHSSGESFHPNAGGATAEGTHLSQLALPPTDSRGSSGSSGDSDELLLDEDKMRAMFAGSRVNIHDEDEVHVTHLSGANWRRRKAEFQLPVVLIHENERGKGAKSNAGPKFAIRESNEDTGPKPAPYKKKRVTTMTGLGSNQSLTTRGPSRAAVDYSNLKNDHPDYWYYSDGRTLIVLKHLNKFVPTSRHNSLEESSTSHRPTEVLLLPPTISSTAPSTSARTKSIKSNTRRKHTWK